MFFKNKIYIIVALISLLISSESKAIKDPMNTSIAFIDRDKIANEALVIKDIKRQVTSIHNDLQKTFSKREEELQQYEANIAKEKELLSKEAFENKVNDLNNSVLQLQRDISEKRANLEKIYMNTIDIVYSKIRDISSDIAKKDNIGIILFLLKNNQVFYASDSMDITDRVLTILNKELPTLEIKKPKI